MMSLGKLITEEMKHSAGNMELTRDSEVEQVVAREVSGQGPRVMNFGGRDQELVIDQPVAKELIGSPEHHLQAPPLDGVHVVGEETARSVR